MEPTRIGGFGFNQMEPGYVQPTNIAELTPPQHLCLNMMVPAGPSPPTREVTPVTPKQMRGVTPVTPSQGQEVLTGTTQEMYGRPGNNRRHHGETRPAGRACQDGTRHLLRPAEPQGDICRRHRET